MPRWSVQADTASGGGGDPHPISAPHMRWMSARQQRFQMNRATSRRKPVSPVSGSCGAQAPAGCCPSQTSHQSRNLPFWGMMGGVVGGV